MDISIADLIVKMDRPAPGLRNLRFASAPASAAPASAAAFNEFLGRIEADESRPADRIASRERPTPAERLPQPDKPEHREERTPAPSASSDAERASAPREAVDRDSRESFSEDRSASSPTDTLPKNETAGDADAGTGDDLHQAAPVSSTGTDAVPAGQAQTAAGPTAATGAPAPRTPSPSAGGSPVPTGQGAATGSAPVPATALAAAQPAQPTAVAETAAAAQALLQEARPAEAAKRSTAATKASGAGAAINAGASVVPGAADDGTASLTDMPDVAVNARAGTMPAMPHVSVFESEAAVPQAGLRTFSVPGLIAAQETAAAATGDAPATQGGGTPPGNAAMPSHGAAGSAAMTRNDTPNTLGPNPMLGLAAANVEVDTAPLPPRNLANNASPVAAAGTTAPATAPMPPAGGATTPASRAQVPMPVPLDQVAVHIARAAANGSDHISIKLKPAALGHVEVKLELTHDGRVAAVITADRSDTLDMLARDAKGLERALADAGLKADSGSLQFNLRGDGQNGNFFASRGDDHYRSDTPQPPDVTGPSATAQAGAYLNLRAAHGGLDIRV